MQRKTLNDLDQNGSSVNRCVSNQNSVWANDANRYASFSQMSTSCSSSSSTPVSWRANPFTSDDDSEDVQRKSCSPNPFNPFKCNESFEPPPRPPSRDFSQYATPMPPPRLPQRDSFSGVAPAPPLPKRRLQPHSTSSYSTFHSMSNSTYTTQAPSYSISSNDAPPLPNPQRKQPQGSVSWDPFNCGAIEAKLSSMGITCEHEHFVSSPKDFDVPIPPPRPEFTSPTTSLEENDGTTLTSFAFNNSNDFNNVKTVDSQFCSNKDSVVKFEANFQSAQDGDSKFEADFSKLNNFNSLINDKIVQRKSPFDDNFTDNIQPSVVDKLNTNKLNNAETKIESSANDRYAPIKEILSPDFVAEFPESQIEEPADISVKFETSFTPPSFDVNWSNPLISNNANKESSGVKPNVTPLPLCNGTSQSLQEHTSPPERNIFLKKDDPFDDEFFTSQT